MMKYKNILLSIVFLLSGVVGVFLSPQLARAAAARCFEEQAPFRASILNNCGAPGGVVSYRDAAGNVLPAGAQPDKCYVHHINPVAAQIFEEASCTDLNTIAVLYYGDLCTNSGGTVSAGDPRINPSRPNGFICQCKQSNTILSADRCIAATNTGVTNATNNPVSGGEDLAIEGSGQKILDLVQNGIDLFTAVAGLAITGMVIVAGIQYSSAGGNPQASANAKKKIGNAFLALITLIFVFTLLQWLIPGGIFG